MKTLKVDKLSKELAELMLKGKEAEARKLWHRELKADPAILNTLAAAVKAEILSKHKARMA